MLPQEVGIPERDSSWSRQLSERRRYEASNLPGPRDVAEEEQKCGRLVSGNEAIAASHRQIS
jgi:hypothetical protein